jgi:hypothetical protein
MDNATHPAPLGSTLSQLVSLSKGQSIEVDGPLSQIYAKTLNAMYAKEIDPATGVCLESQANDATNAANLLKVQQGTPRQYAGQGVAVGFLYGLSKGRAGVSDVIQIADALSKSSQMHKGNSAVIVDAAIGLGPDGNYAPLPLGGQDSLFERAVLAVAQDHGVAVFESLQGFLDAKGARH